MKKVLVCNNCHTENPFYQYNCIKCNAFLRTKIANIDLWDTLWKLLESPVKTGEQIIHAEHKNFVVIILILAGLKIGLSLLVFANAVLLFDNEISNPWIFIITASLYFVIFLLVVSFLITFFNNMFGLKNRFRDNVALYSYSFLPIVLTLIVLTPIEIAIYGIYWFTFNPSPLMFKPITTYVLLFIECLFIIWSFVLIITSTYSQCKNIFYSILVGLCVVFTLALTMFYSLKFSYQ